MSKPTNTNPGQVFGAGIYHGLNLLMEQGMIPAAIKIKYPTIDPMLIVSIRTTEGPKIAFITAGTLDQLGKLFEGKVRADAIEWREDKFELERLARSESM